MSFDNSSQKTDDLFRFSLSFEVFEIQLLNIELSISCTDSLNVLDFIHCYQKKNIYQSSSVFRVLCLLLIDLSTRLPLWDSTVWLWYSIWQWTGCNTEAKPSTWNTRFYEFYWKTTWLLPSSWYNIWITHSCGILFEIVSKWEDRYLCKNVWFNCKKEQLFPTLRKECWDLSTV